MTEAVSNIQPSCRDAAVVVAAYLDGDLEGEASQLFERHARDCRPCASALNEQKRLLCLLDAAFDSRKPEKDFQLPKNFARVVTAHAQTDLGGMRRGSEHGRALLLCSILAAASFCLLGVTTFGAALSLVAGFARAALSLLGMVGHTVGDASAGGAVILRTVGGRLIAEPYPFKLLTWTLFAGAVVLLRRLIGSYHRARQ